MKKTHKNNRAHGIGIVDTNTMISKNIQSESYKKWYDMLHRVRSHRAYVNVTICNEWLTYSNFKQWFDVNYIDGWEIDKDILSNESKVYSPSTCIFVPKELNKFFVTQKTELPVGVSWCKEKQKYKAQISIGNKNKFIGRYDSISEASEEYKKYKVAYGLLLLYKYQNSINPNVFEHIKNKIYKIKKE